ncbi:hypothetical protein SAMN05519103_09055 [Rhizobiales bacterium GAS113]|nr:hypothetical protein SAMN05519103_09055 [Rhizobiales bacterium GAS113]
MRDGVWHRQAIRRLAAFRFLGVDRLVADEASLRDHVDEIAEHKRQLLTLDRREVRTHAATPWGAAQISRVYADGVVCHSTPEHGGFHLDEERNALVHAAYRNDGGWYEEDSQLAKAAASFPDLFTDCERKCADRTLRHDEPDAYELINGIMLRPGESHTKDARQFRIDRADHWLVISAITSRLRPRFVECVATLGGDRRSKDERRFLVPADEYRVGWHGFVIDESRHELYDGPSDFIGWGRG